MNIENKNLSYNKDGALWFKNTLFGDDKDRVLIKKNGDMTYFATDIAYHVHKFKHHDVLIDIWEQIIMIMHRDLRLHLKH